MDDELTSREKTVLRYVVRDFIETATPVGSRYISKRHEAELGLSSASVRNVLSDLEERGFIDHPHTSAGRVPTDLGYRKYLDSLMELERVSLKDQQTIRTNLETAEDTERVLREVSRVLGRISRQLCIIVPPSMTSGKFEKLELVPLPGNRLMIVISIASGLVRTIMMEVASEIPREKLNDLSRSLNERLSGLLLSEIRETFVERIKTIQDDDTGLIRLFIESVDKLFKPQSSQTVHIGGTGDILAQPEFVNAEDFRSVIELVNNEEMIIHILEKQTTSGHGVNITIGKENPEERLHPYSVITSPYNAHDAQGSIGVIGPRRMPYYRIIPLLDYVARTVSELFLTNPQ